MRDDIKFVLCPSLYPGLVPTILQQNELKVSGMMPSIFLDFNGKQKESG
jgi:hypothetical protein